MRKLPLLALLVWLLYAAGCSLADPQPGNRNTNMPETTDNPSLSSGSVKLVEAYPNLAFNQPLDYRPANDDSGRVFVVEKSGKILVFHNDPQVQTAQIFLDLTSRVDSRSSEKGLLGLALHPDYKNNGLFYVNYTNQNNTVIARYQVSPADSNQALLSSEKIILTFSQPYANHNGGQLAFGPDGYLYIGSGDGGSAGDPQNNAQNLGNLLGKILRIDVNSSANGMAYAIPPDNPFFGNQQGFKEEIYAYGLRNPWKFSFDQVQGRLWAADVGQNKVEEIDIINKGANYGWNKMEGSLFYPSTASYNTAGFTMPVWEYQHPQGNAITGGYVYYGKSAPSLNGWYVFGDFATGMIWAVRLDENMKAESRTLLDTDYNISSFGLDQNNELYVLDYNGKIYKLVE
ncbi:MAG TPA: glucose sorbosone dehydrogenase [Syntrophomonas sp.]|jgi:glucose/arabinose dehydrogenase|nr:glucose sorbosone dehydrogenase [Syntrophomonas sp.]